MCKTFIYVYNIRKYKSMWKIPKTSDDVSDDCFNLKTRR